MDNLKVFVAVPVARFQSSFNGGRPVLSAAVDESAEPPQSEDAREERQEEQVDTILNNSSSSKTDDEHDSLLSSFIHSFPEQMRAGVQTVLHCMKENHLKFRPDSGEMVDAHDKLIQHSNMKSIIHSILSSKTDDAVLTSTADLRGRHVIMLALAHAHINPFVLFPNADTRAEYDKIRDTFSK